MNKHLDIKKISHFILIIIGLTVILIYSREYAIPFIIALLVWFIIHELRENIQQVPWLKKNCPMWLQSAIGFVVINAVILLLLELLYVSMSELLESIAVYESNLDKSLLQINALTGVDLSDHALKYIQEIDLAATASTLFDYISVLLGDSFLILIYVLFLLLEESVFNYKLDALYSDEKMESPLAFSSLMAWFFLLRVQSEVG